MIHTATEFLKDTYVQWEPTVRPYVDFATEKASLIAKKVLYPLILIVCFKINPTLSALGFVISIIMDESTQDQIAKIKAICENNLFKLTFLTIFCIAAFLSVTVTCATVSVLAFAHLGSSLALEAYPLSERNPSSNVRAQHTSQTLYDNEGKPIMTTVKSVIYE